MRQEIANQLWKIALEKMGFFHFSILFYMYM